MERRLSAILVADTVGYSRMVEADEVRTLARLKRLRAELIDPAIAGSGRIVKELGDGLLAEFPSVVEAVTAAVAIQRRLADAETELPESERIRLRIGINLGDIIAENGDIFGEGVIVAARLEQLAEPGGICVSGTAYDHLKPITDVGYHALGETRVKNIDRPVRVYRVLNEGDTTVPRGRSVRRLLAPLIGIAALITLAVLGALWLSGEDHVPAVVAGDGARSLAVLPFENTGGDPGQEYFVDGMTDDLITDLSKISSLFVIARNSAFAYKGRNAAPRDVASELGVRYILAGSVRHADGQVRINARLVDTQTGGQIWADRFDSSADEIFALQDAVTRQIVAALQVELTPEEKNRIVSTGPETSTEVYDLYLRGVEQMRRFTPEGTRQSRSYFLAALARDPDFARAHAAMAFSFITSGDFFRRMDTDDQIAQARLYARRAIELDPELPQGHVALALALLRDADHDAALAQVHRAIELDPNYADAYVTLATILNHAGRAPEAVGAMEKAMELNPRYSAAYIDILGRAYFLLEDYDKAIELLEQCIERDPELLTCRAYLTAALWLTGQMEDAKWHAEEMRMLAPDFRARRNPFLPQLKREEDRARLANAWAAAGLGD